METTSKRYIDVTDEAKAKLAKFFKCTETMVYMALTYRKNSDLARKIQYVAVRDFKGKPMRHLPECETLHNITEGGRDLMVQIFDNGIRLEVDKNTGHVDAINRRGENVGRWECESIPDLSRIQMIVQGM